MKLSEYAKKNSITYRTAYNHWEKGLIKGRQLVTGTIVVDNEFIEQETGQNIAIYARVSSSENKSNLETQAERLVSFANAKGYKVSKIVKEIGSGLNDKRPKLNSLLNDPSLNIIIVEHKDRLCRFGINYIEVLLEQQGRKIEVVNPPSDEKEDLIADFVSIITSFCVRIYGQRRNKRKTEQLIKELS